jgi:hypothetical protein
MADPPNGEDPPNIGREFAESYNETAEPRMDEPKITDIIGDRLKQYYSKRLSQPLPDKFAELLRELAKKEAK